MNHTIQNDFFQIATTNTSSSTQRIDLFALGDSGETIPKKVGNISLVHDDQTDTNLRSGLNSSGVAQTDGTFTIVFYKIDDVTDTIELSVAFSFGDTLESIFNSMNNVLSLTSTSIKVRPSSISLTSFTTSTSAPIGVDTITFQLSAPIEYSLARTDFAFVRIGGNTCTYNFSTYPETKIESPNGVRIASTDTYDEILNSQNGNDYQVYFIYGLAKEGGGEVIDITRFDSNGDEITDSFTPVIDPYSFQSVYQINPTALGGLDLNGRARVGYNIEPNSTLYLNFYYNQNDVSDVLKKGLAPVDKERYAFPRFNYRDNLPLEEKRTQREFNRNYLLSDESFNLLKNSKKNTTFNALDIIVPIAVGFMVLQEI